MRRRRNPRFQLAPVAINVAVIAGGAWLVYWLGKKLLDKFRSGIDGPADALAKAVVGKPMELSNGITYILPDGRKVPAAQTQLVGPGATFLYGTAKYKAIAASPPGSGFYTTQRVS